MNCRQSVFCAFVLFLLPLAMASVQAGQTGFGENGYVLSSVDGFPDASGGDIVIDKNGRLLVSGAVGDFSALVTPDELAVVRYLPDGTLDTTFSLDGSVATTFSGSSVRHVNGIVVDSLNRVAIAGWGTNINPGGNEFALARFTLDGSADVSFDFDGKVTTAFPDATTSFANDLVLTSDNGLLAVGEVNLEDGPIGGGVARYDESGNLDATIGVAGLSLTASPNRDSNLSWQAVSMDAIGRAVVVGTATNPMSFVAARYTPDGQLDPTFAEIGLRTVDFGSLSEAHAVTVDPEGRSIIAGCVVVPGISPRGFALVRLLDSGMLDVEFGVDGLVTTEFIDDNLTNPSGCVNDVAIDAKGRIVAIGFVEDPANPGQQTMAVARYLSDGTLDTSFGNGGTVLRTLSGQSNLFSRGVALDSEGRILVSGTARFDDENFFAVVCFNEYGFPCRDYPFEYAAKVVCGIQEDVLTGPVARGFYTTTVNIHNPSPSTVSFFKKLALTRPPATQTAGEIRPISVDKLHYDEALAADCPDLWRRLFPNDPPGQFLEGFLIIQSEGSLDVTSVYSTAGLDEDDRPGAHSSIDVERIEERLPGVELSVSKMGEEYQIEITDQLIFHAILYSIIVTNGGTQPAADVTITDEQVLSSINTVGVAAILDDPVEIPVGAQVGSPVFTPPSASVEFELGDIAPGAQAEVRFWAIALQYIFGSPASASLNNSATANADGVGFSGSGSVTIQTQLLP